MSSNPIDGIRFGGVMGFMLGDSYEFCLSRFKHLNLQVKTKMILKAKLIKWEFHRTETNMSFGAKMHIIM